MSDIELDGWCDELASRIDAGVQLLDESNLTMTWPFSIDVEKLDMADWLRCVLGQLFGTYADGTRLLLLELSAEPAMIAAVRHGFDIDSLTLPVTYQSNYAALTELWRERIEVLQAERFALITP